MNVETLPPDHVWERPLSPAADQMRIALHQALGNWPTRCEVDAVDLSLIVQPLEGERFIVVGRRALAGLQRPGGSSTAFVDADRWEVGIVRYYGRAWAIGDPGHAAEAILDDFAPAVFVREWQLHHCDR